MDEENNVIVKIILAKERNPATHIFLAKEPLIYFLNETLSKYLENGYRIINIHCYR